MTQASVNNIEKDNTIDISSLSFYTNPLRPILDDPNVTDICINRPHEAYVLAYDGWHSKELSFADAHWCRSMGNLVANRTRQSISENNPILSADMPSGERIQFVLPPAAEHVSITIRRPSSEVWTLDELAERGLFKHCRETGGGLEAIEQELLGLKKKQKYVEFLKLAIQNKMNIICSGVTGSGKTTASKAMILEVPSEERILVIEDAKELILNKHPNHVRMFYSKGDQGMANVTPKMLLESCLRMKPDRIFLAELRGEEAFEYLRVVASHPGSITSVHGHTADLALAQMMLLIRQSEAGQSLKPEEVRSLLYQTIDIVVQFAMNGTTRFVKEIWYKPDLKRGLLDGQNG
ncbi:Type IV secretion system protein VirB11 [biofilm metagenome]